MMALVGLLCISVSAAEPVPVPVEVESVAGDIVLPIVWDKGLVSPEFVSVGAGLVRKLPYGTHYVFWGDSDGWFYFASDDGITYDGTTFVGSDVSVIRLALLDGGGASWSASVSSDFSFAPGGSFVWSDLGPYPLLTGRGDYYGQAACVILCSFALFYLFNRLRWGFCGSR